MIKWPEFKIPPINLWSAPKQEIDYMRKEVINIANDAIFSDGMAMVYEKAADMDLKHLKIAKAQLKDLEFIYYTRTGRFPE